MQSKSYLSVCQDHPFNAKPSPDLFQRITAFRRMNHSAIYLFASSTGHSPEKSQQVELNIRVECQIAAGPSW